MKEFIGRKYRYYRLGYNIFSIISLIPVIYFQYQLDEKIIYTWPWPWYFLKYGMYVVAFLLFYGGYRVYDLQYMLGIKQIKKTRYRDNKNTMEFTTKGILGYVRHPWYSGTILLVWAFDDITDVSLISKVVLTVYIIIGTLLEEKKLIAEIGQPYLIYRSRVPMLIPRKKRFPD